MSASILSLCSLISVSGGLRRESSRGDRFVFVEEETEETVSGLFGVFLDGVGEVERSRLCA